MGIKGPMTDFRTLATTLKDGDVALLPFNSAHAEGLREACALDREVWDIYPISMIGEHFDRSLKMLESLTGWTRFAVLKGERVVGMTSFIPTPATASLDAIEIGGTYITPDVRGTATNRMMKRLLINHAFECGFEEIQFRVDTRNTRSMRAVEKLGAQLSATEQKNMTTWTGYVRDTAVFRLSQEEWAQSEAESIPLPEKPL